MHAAKPAAVNVGSKKRCTFTSNPEIRVKREQFNKYWAMRKKQRLNLKQKRVAALPDGKHFSFFFFF